MSLLKKVIAYFRPKRATNINKIEIHVNTNRPAVEIVKHTLDLISDIAFYHIDD